MGHILYQIFKIFKKRNEKIDNSIWIRIYIYSITIYVVKTENIIPIKIKTGYYLELLTPETIQLIGRTENKDKNGENVPHSEITEVVLVQLYYFQ